MARVFPESLHCYCLRHLKDNLKTKFSGGDAFFAIRRNDFVKLLEECVVAATVPLFEQKMRELLALGGTKMKNFIRDIPLEKWTEAYCYVSRYGETTSNGVESFNGWVIELRELHITEMVDKLRVKLMIWFDERSTMSGAWKTILCEKYQERWNTSLHNGLSLTVIKSSYLVYEVLSDPSHSVDLNRQICSCHMWKIDRFPCSHAVICIVKAKLPIEQFVEDWFLAETYRKSYVVPISPVPTSVWRNSKMLDKSKILPPTTKRPPGRPKKIRIPSKGEIVSKKKLAIRCGRCKKFLNHNKITCKEPISV